MVQINLITRPHNYYHKYNLLIIFPIPLNDLELNTLTLNNPPFWNGTIF